MIIYVANKSTVLSDAQVQAALPAFQTFAGHVNGVWPRKATLQFNDNPPTESWQILILDNSDQAGALGYHDYTPGGKPISKVFAATDQQYGYSWTVTLTHELAEMMADPWICEALQVSNNEFYAKEIGDPVEADNFGYHITTPAGLSVLVSDFVSPAWFIPGAPGPYDHAQHVTKPLQILSGGYMSIFVSCKGWTQVNAEGKEVALDKSDPRYRDRG